MLSCRRVSVEEESEGRELLCRDRPVQTRKSQRRPNGARWGWRSGMTKVMLAKPVLTAIASEEELIRRRRVAQGNTHVPRLVEPGGRAPVDALQRHHALIASGTKRELVPIAPILRCWKERAIG